MRILALLTLSPLLVFAGSVQAQVYPWPGYETHPQVMAERARAADAAQRARSDEQAAFARQQMDSARITRLELDAARRALPQMAPSPLDRPAALPSADANIHTRQSVEQIDAWLDRRPD